VGACFDEADVQMIANAAQLDTALNGLAANDQAVLVLTGSDYAGVTQEISDSAEVALIASGNATVSGNSGFAVIGVSANAIVYFSGITVGPNGTGAGVDCSGTSVWIDDGQVSGNAGVGLDISGGCAAHLRRTVVRANAGGGMVVDGATTSLAMENSVVGDNVGAAAGPGVRVISADIAITYSTVVSNGTFANPDNIECLSGAGGEVRNSIFSGPNGNSIITCAGLSWDYNAIDTSGLGGTNDNVGMYDAAWFVSPGTGNYGLSSAGEPEFMDISQWQDGDPLADFEGDPIPTDMPSFPGYDQP
jgi:hypothetical protein